MSRTALLQKLIDPRRDLEGECGYIKGDPDPRIYRELYDRQDVAARVVDLWPDECWSVYPELFESEDENVETPFEKAWIELSRKVNPWYYLHRIDELSGIGRFGALFMGYDDVGANGSLATPLDNLDPFTGEVNEGGTEKKLLFLRTFDEAMVEVSEIETKGPRSGQAKYYNIDFGESGLNTPGVVQSGTTASSKDKVHWSRVIHVADNRKNSEIFGTPRQKPVLNRLLDLRKILGGSGEMFWRGAFAGHAFETLPELIALGMVELDEESLKDQYEDYSNGLKRFLALNGMKATSLAPQVADPTQHVIQHLSAIAIALKVPLRIFLGSEAGHLASTQDTGTWNRRLARRQLSYLTPMLINPFVDRLIAVKQLPKPDKYRVEWTDLNAMSDKDKADISLKKTQALMQFVSGGAETACSMIDYYVHFLGFDRKTAEQMVENAKKVKGSRMTEEVFNKPEPSPFGQGGSLKQKMNRTPRNSLGNGKGPAKR